MLKKIINILKEYFQNLVKSIIRDDYANAAGEMAYMTALGIFPFMLFLMAVFGWLGKTFFINKIIFGLSTIAPQSVIDMINGVLAEVVIFKSGKLMAIVGFFVTIFLTSNAIAVIIRAYAVFFLAGVTFFPSPATASMNFFIVFPPYFG